MNMLSNESLNREYKSNRHFLPMNNLVCHDGDPLPPQEIRRHPKPFTIRINQMKPMDSINHHTELESRDYAS